MTHLDPDQDILEKLDRQERVADVTAAAKSLAGGLVVALAVYEVAIHVIGAKGEIPRDSAIVVLICATVWLFRRLDKNH